jgi:hypothetical protein
MLQASKSQKQQKEITGVCPRHPQRHSLNKIAKEKSELNSYNWFRSSDLRVMSPALFP